MAKQTIPQDHSVRRIFENLADRAIEAGQDYGPDDVTVADIKTAIIKAVKASTVGE